MLDDIFFLKLILSGVVAGSYAVLSLYLAEKMGTRLGGIVLSLPSTIVWSLLFIGWTQGTDAAIRATEFSPVGIFLSPLFVACFVLFVPRLKSGALILSVLGWLLCAALLVFLQVPFEWYLPFAVLSFLLALSYLKHFKSVSVPLRATSRELLYRFLFVGGVTACVVLMARELGPEVGGIFSTFPVLYSSSWFVLIRQRGAEFARSFAANAIWGAPSFLLYPFLVRVLFPPFGILFGTVATYLISLVFFLFVNTLLSKKFHFFHDDK